MYKYALYKDNKYCCTLSITDIHFIKHTKELSVHQIKCFDVKIYSLMIQNFKETLARLEKRKHWQLKTAVFIK